MCELVLDRFVIIGEASCPCCTRVVSLSSTSLVVAPSRLELSSIKFAFGKVGVLSLINDLLVSTSFRRSIVANAVALPCQNHHGRVGGTDIIRALRCSERTIGRLFPLLGAASLR